MWIKAIDYIPNMMYCRILVAYKIILNLASGISTDEDIMECIKNDIENNIVVLAIDTTNNKYSAVITYDNTNILDGNIVSMGVHIIVNKRYWGPESRKIIFDAYKWMKENMKPIQT